MNRTVTFCLLGFCWLIAALFLGLAIFGVGHTSVFYTNLRWVCCVAFGVPSLTIARSAVNNYGGREDRDYAVVCLFAALVFGGLAVLFNPFLPFHFPKATWHLIDKFVFGFLLLLLFIDTQIILEELSPLLLRWTKALALIAIGLAVATHIVARGIDVTDWIVSEKIIIDAKIVETLEDVNEDYSATLSGFYRFTIGNQTFEGYADGEYQVGDTVRVLYKATAPAQNHAETDRGQPLSNYFPTLLVGGLISFLLIAHGAHRIREIWRNQAAAS